LKPLVKTVDGVAREKLKVVSRDSDLHLIIRLGATGAKSRSIFESGEFRTSLIIARAMSSIPTAFGCGTSYFAGGYAQYGFNSANKTLTKSSRRGATRSRIWGIWSID
jgi:hypothetical protein